MISSAFISMVCDINRIAKPAVLTQPKVKPEVVSMDETAEASEPKIEVVASNDAPAQEEASDNKTEE